MAVRSSEPRGPKENLANQTGAKPWAPRYDVRRVTLEHGDHAGSIVAIFRTRKMRLDGRAGEYASHTLPGPLGPCQSSGDSLVLIGILSI